MGLRLRSCRWRRSRVNEATPMESLGDLQGQGGAGSHQDPTRWTRSRKMTRRARDKSNY